MARKIFFLLIVLALARIGAACTLTVLYPNGGELLNLGKIYTIQWTTEGNGCGDAVTIDLYLQGEYSATIAESADNNGSYAWTVPNDLFWSPFYTIKITDEKNPNVSDESDDVFGVIGLATTFYPDYVIPVAAHADGAYGSHWKTDLTLYNNCIDLAVYLLFIKSDQDNSNPDYAGLLLPSMHARELKDVVASVIGKEDGVGAILIDFMTFGPAIACDLAAQSRTYNDQGEDGTYGQMIPAFPFDESILTYSNTFIGLKQNDHYRTNMGFVNGSTFPITVHVTLKRENYETIGEKDISLMPYSFHQEVNIIGQETTENVEDVIAVVDSDTPDAVYFAYASVIDNRTGDAIFIQQSRPPCQ